MPKYRTRKGASVYIYEKFGVNYSANTLQKFACVGGGPEYQIIGNRSVYTDAILDEWMDTRVSAPRRFAGEITSPGTTD